MMKSLPIAFTALSLFLFLPPSEATAAERLGLGTVYREEIENPAEFPVAIAPGEKELLVIKKTASGSQPTFSIVDLKRGSSATVALTGLEGLNHLVLRDLRPYQGNQLVASAAWVEGSSSKGGLLFLNREGALQTKRAFSALFWGIDVLPGGGIVASVQEPRDPVGTTKHGEAMFDLWILDAKESGRFERRGLSNHGELASYSSWREQHDDLRQRRVFSFGTGYLMTQARFKASVVTQYGSMADLKSEFEPSARHITHSRVTNSVYIKPPQKDRPLVVLDMVPVEMASLHGFMAVWTELSAGSRLDAGKNHAEDVFYLCSYTERGGSPVACRDLKGLGQRFFALHAGEGKAYALFMEVQDDAKARVRKTYWRLDQIDP